MEWIKKIKSKKSKKDIGKDLSESPPLLPTTSNSPPPPPSLSITGSDLSSKSRSLSVSQPSLPMMSPEASPALSQPSSQHNQQQQQQQQQRSQTKQRVTPKWAATITLSYDDDDDNSSGNGSTINSARRHKDSASHSRSNSNSNYGSPSPITTSLSSSMTALPSITTMSSTPSSTSSLIITPPDNATNSNNNTKMGSNGFGDNERGRARSTMKAQWAQESAESTRKLTEKAIAEAEKANTAEELIAYAEKFSNFLGTGVIVGDKPGDMAKFFKSLLHKCVQHIAAGLESHLGNINNTNSTDGNSTITALSTPPRDIAVLSKLLLCLVICGHSQKGVKPGMELSDWELGAVDEMIKKNVHVHLVRMLTLLMTTDCTVTPTPADADAPGAAEHAQEGTPTPLAGIKSPVVAAASPRDDPSRYPNGRLSRVYSSPRLLPSQATVAAAIIATGGSQAMASTGGSSINNGSGGRSIDPSLKLIMSRIVRDNFPGKWDFLVLMLGLMCMSPKASAALRSADQLYNVFILSTSWEFPKCVSAITTNNENSGSTTSGADAVSSEEIGRKTATMERTIQELRNELCESVMPPLLQRSVDKTSLNYLLGKGAVARLVECSQRFCDAKALETATLTCEWVAGWLRAEAHAKGMLLLKQFTEAEGYDVFTRCLVACESAKREKPEWALGLFTRVVKALTTLTPCSLEDRHVVQKSAYNQHVIDANGSKFTLPSFITNHRVLIVLKQFLCSSAWDPAQTLVLETVKTLYAENPLNMIAMERFRIMEHIFAHFDSFSSAIKREVVSLAVFKVVKLDWVPFEELTALNTLITQSRSTDTLYHVLTYVGKMAGKSNALKANLAEAGVLSNLLVIFGINCDIIKSANNTNTNSDEKASDEEIKVAKEKVSHILVALTQLVTDYKPNALKIREDNTAFMNTLSCIYIKECRYAALGFWYQVMLMDTLGDADNFQSFVKYFMSRLDAEKEMELVEVEAMAAAAACTKSKRRKRKQKKGNSAENGNDGAATPDSGSSDKPSAAEDSPALIKMDVLDVLCRYVSASNANKDVFRENDGFDCIMILLEKFRLPRRPASAPIPSTQNSLTTSPADSENTLSCIKSDDGGAGGTGDNEDNTSDSDSDSDDDDDSDSSSSDSDEEDGSDSTNTIGHNKLIEVTNLFDGILTLITNAILHHDRNRRYFTETVRFDTIERGLLESGVLLKHPTSAARLLSRLISLTTETAAITTMSTTATTASHAVIIPSTPTKTTSKAAGAQSQPSSSSSSGTVGIVNPQALLIGVRHLHEVPEGVALNFIASIDDLAVRAFSRRQISCSGLTGAVLDVLNTLYTETNASDVTAMAPRDGKLTRALLDLVVRLSESGTTCEDLHKLLRLVRKPRIPGTREDGGLRLEIMEVLERVCSLDPAAMVPAVLFDRTASGFSCAQVGVPDRSWPPAGGYSFSVWVYIDAFGAREIDVLGFQIQDPRNRAVLAISPAGAPLFYVGDTRQQHQQQHQPHVLGDVRLAAGRWYHLALVHPKALLRGVDSSFYVDGALVWTGRLPHMSSVSPPVTVTFNSLTLQPEPADGMRWRLGATYLFDRPIAPLAILTLYLLGPAFFKSTAASSAACLEEYQSFGIVSARNIDLVQKMLPAWDPAKSLGPLYLGNICGSSGKDGGSGSSNSGAGSKDGGKDGAGALGGDGSGGSGGDNSVSPSTSSDAVVSDPDELSLNISENHIVFCLSAQNENVTFGDGQQQQESSIVNTLGSSNARVTLLGTCQSVNPCSVPQCFVRVGGMAVALPLVARATTRKELLLALKIVAALVRRSARNFAEMNALDGYQVLAIHLRKKAVLLGGEHMRVLFKLVGFDSARDPPESRVLANVAAFRSLFLNLGIWKETGDVAFMHTVLATTCELVTKSRYAAFNAAQLRAVHAISLLYMQLREESFPEGFIPQAFAIVEAICLQVMAKDDLRHLVGFAMSLVPLKKKALAQSQVGGSSAPTLPALPLDGSISGSSSSGMASAAAAAAAAAATGSSPAGTTGTSTSSSGTGTGSSNTVPRSTLGSGNYRPLSSRAMCACNMALRTVYKILVSGHKNVSRLAAAIHPFWVFHFITRRLNAETVGLAVRILAVLYNNTSIAEGGGHKNKFAELFRKKNGFRNLGWMLRPFSANPVIYYSLLCLMFAPDMSKVQLAPKFDGNTLFTTFEKDSIRIAAPEVFPIIIELFKKSYSEMPPPSSSSSSSSSSGSSNTLAGPTSPSTSARHARLAGIAQQTNAATAATLVRVPAKPFTVSRSRAFPTAGDSAADQMRQRGVSVSIPRPNFGGSGASGGSSGGGVGLRGMRWQQQHSDDSALKTSGGDKETARAELVEMQQTLGKLFIHLYDSMPAFKALIEQKKVVMSLVSVFFPENKLRITDSNDAKNPLVGFYRLLLLTAKATIKESPRFTGVLELVRGWVVPTEVSDSDIAAFTGLLVFDLAEDIEMLVNRKVFAESETLSSNIAAFCTFAVRLLMQGAFGPDTAALRKLFQFLFHVLNNIEADKPFPAASGLIKASSTRGDVQAIFSAMGRVILLALQQAPLVPSVLANIIKTPNIFLSRTNADGDFFRAFVWCLFPHLAAEDPALRGVAVEVWVLFCAYQNEIVAPILAMHKPLAGENPSDFIVAAAATIANPINSPSSTTPQEDGTPTSGSSSSPSSEQSEGNAREIAAALESATSNAYKAWCNELAKQNAEGKSIVVARRAPSNSDSNAAQVQTLLLEDAAFEKDRFKWATGADNTETQHFSSWIGDESDRQEYIATRWNMLELGLRTHSRCVWAEESFFLCQKWKLDFTETAFRMRPKFAPDHQFYKRYPFIPQDPALAENGAAGGGGTGAPGAAGTSTPRRATGKSQRRVPTSEDSKLWYETFDRAYVDAAIANLKNKSLAVVSSPKMDVQQGARRRRGGGPQTLVKPQLQLGAKPAVGDAAAATAAAKSDTVGATTTSTTTTTTTTPKKIKVIGPDSEVKGSNGADDADKEHDVSKMEGSEEGDATGEEKLKGNESEEESESESESDDEYDDEDDEFTLEHKFQRYMEPDDRIQEAFNCEIADAMDTYPGVLLICTRNVYMIEGYKFCDAASAAAAASSTTAAGGSLYDSDEEAYADSNGSGSRRRTRWASRRAARSNSGGNNGSGMIPMPVPASSVASSTSPSSGGGGGRRGSGTVTWSRLRHGEQVVVEVEKAGFSSSFELKGLHTCSRWEKGSICLAIPRRYALQWKALEIFVSGGRNHLLVFSHRDEVEEVRKLLQQGASGKGSGGGACASSLLAVTGGVAGLLFGSGSLPAPGKELGFMTQQWVNGRISNFLYLMYVNTVAGRTFNDLSQYPVFPWVIADYTSEELDLSDPKTFRDLSKPIGALDPENARKVREHFRDCEGTMGDRPAYHYSQLYSSAAVVCYYLVRLEPFSKPIIDLNNGHWDCADRLFFEVADTWNMLATGSAMQVMELIPEFYYLPEAFENRNRFVFGRRANTSEVVSDVRLPPWAHGSAREFVRRNREALESPYVSAHLNEWIDLIFGYKQRGEAAKEALNVFTPESYEGAVDIDAITDEVERRSRIEMIRNFGQVPQQLWDRVPHPAKNPAVLVPPPVPAWASSSSSSSSSTLLASVVSSNNDAWPIRVIRVDASRKVLSAGPRKAIVMDPQRVLVYGTPDGAIRVSSGDKYIATVCSGHDGPVTAAQVSSTGAILVTGGLDTVVKVFRLRKQMGPLGVGPGGGDSVSSSGYTLGVPGVSVAGAYEGGNAGSAIDGAGELGGRYRLCSNLCGHFAPITEVAFSSIQKVVVSGDRAGVCLLWDLNAMTLVRELSIPEALGRRGPIVAISINSITGTIAVCTARCVTLWTVNGELLAQAFVPKEDSITSCVLSSGFVAGAGSGGEVLVTGHARGKIRVWDAEVFTNSETAPPAIKIRTKYALPDTSSTITALHVPYSDRTKLYAGTSRGSVFLFTDPPQNKK